MLADVVSALACPTCDSALTPEPGVLRCPAGHSFDVARQGYVNLLAGAPAPGTADSPDMVAARHDFLAAGHYAPLVAALAERAAALGGDGLVLDAGAGTGHHLAAVLDRRPGSCGLALDISKHALRRAARAHDRLGAAACDVWRGLPVRTGAASVLLNVFAPRNGAEFRRVLRPDGALLVVTPDAAHLAELVSALGLIGVDPRKDERLADALSDHFHLVDRWHREFPLRLSRADAATAVRMGPSARHLSGAELAGRAAALAEPVPVTASVLLSVYRPRGAADRHEIRPVG